MLTSLIGLEANLPVNNVNLRNNALVKTQMKVYTKNRVPNASVQHTYV